MLSADEVLIPKDIINIKTFEEKVSIIEEKTFLAIQTKNYKHIIELLQSCAIIPWMTINGKELTINAPIYDKTKMILLFASYGAMII